MCHYRNGNGDKPEIILYDYRTSRFGDNAVDFLEGFKGFIHTDGYCGNSKLTGVTRCRCWANLRRKFIEAIPSKCLTDKLTNAEMGRDYCDKLFEIERKVKDLSAKERKAKSLKEVKTVLDPFLALAGKPRCTQRIRIRERQNICPQSENVYGELSA